MKIAGEIRDAWFATPYADDDWNPPRIERVRQLEDSARALRPTEDA